MTVPGRPADPVGPLATPAAPAATAATAAEPVPEAAVALRVVSYNVAGLGHDAAAVVRVLRACAPDVALLQEAPRRWQWRSRCAALARRSGLRVVCGGRAGGGNLLLAAPRVRVGPVVARRFPVPWGEPVRGAAAAELSVAGARFGAIASHLSLRAELRARQVGWLLGLSAEVGERAGRPVLLGVDVNEPIGGPAWTTLAAAGFRPAAGAPPTVPSREPDRRVDAVLGSRGVRFVGRDVPDQLAEPLDLVRASDHRPVLARCLISVR